MPEELYMQLLKELINCGKHLSCRKSAERYLDTSSAPHLHGHRILEVARTGPSNVLPSSEAENSKQFCHFSRPDTTIRPE